MDNGKEEPRHPQYLYPLKRHDACMTMQDPYNNLMLGNAPRDPNGIRVLKQLKRDYATEGVMGFAC